MARLLTLSVRKKRSHRPRKDQDGFIALNWLSFPTEPF